MEEIKLRDYQIKLVEKSREALKKNKHIIVQAATGAGKTFCFSYLAKLSTQKGRKVVILSNRVELLIQSEGSLRRLGVEAEYISPSHKKVPTGNCIVAMAQTLRARFGKPEWKEFLKSVDILIVDEIHMQDANYLLESDIFKDKFVLGFTATPRRGGNQRQLGLDFAEIVDAVTTQDLIDGGYLVPAVHYTLDAPDLSKLTEINRMTGDYNETSMAALFDNPKMYAGVIDNYKTLTPDTKAIVFCCNQTHAIQTCIEFENAGISARFLVSGLKKTDKGYDMFKNNQHLTGKRKTVVKEFGEGKFQVLCNASILTTGFDCPSIETVIVNRATQSLALWMQCLDSETEVLCNTGWKNIYSIEKTDLCAGYNINNGEISYVPILNIYKRTLNEGEKMYGIKNNYVDIRVTGGHRMVISKRINKKYTPFEFCEAEKIPSLYNDNIRMPVCGDINTPNCGLSKWELRFVGLFLSDGTLNKNQLTISQSVNNSTISEIEDIIERCGLCVNKSITRRTETNFGKASDMIYYRISKIYDRGKNKGLKGWDYLSPYIDKSMGYAFDKLSHDDLKELMHGFYIGNGSKTKKITWVKHTYTVCLSNKEKADRMQSLLVTHGFKSSIYPTSSKAYLLHYSFERKYKTMRTYSTDNRQLWGVLDSMQGEEVWCVENKLNTLVTRRNGKVTIMGNCIGRGSRPYPGKTYFNILDFGDNVKRHGAYELERKWSVWHDTKEGGGVPMTKECPVDEKDHRGKTGCGRLIHIGYSECPFCGYIFKTPEELRIVELSKIVDGFELKDMTPQQLVAYAELKHYNKYWVIRQLFYGAEDRRQFVAAMKQLGYDYKFIYRTYDEYRKRTK